jgi:hypothetical protein
MTRRPDAPSLDRISKHKPYTKENTRVILWAVNCALAEYGTTLMLPILKAMIKGIEDANQGSITSLPTESDTKGQGDSKPGLIPTPWFGKDDDIIDDTGGAV